MHGVEHLGCSRCSADNVEVAVWDRPVITWPGQAFWEHGLVLRCPGERPGEPALGRTQQARSEYRGHFVSLDNKHPGTPREMFGSGDQGFAQTSATAYLGPCHEQTVLPVRARLPSGPVWDYWPRLLAGLPGPDSQDQVHQFGRGSGGWQQLVSPEPSQVLVAQTSALVDHTDDMDAGMLGACYVRSGKKAHDVVHDEDVQLRGGAHQPELVHHDLDRNALCVVAYIAAQRCAPRRLRGRDPEPNCHSRPPLCGPLPEAAGTSGAL